MQSGTLPRPLNCSPSCDIIPTSSPTLLVKGTVKFRPVEWILNRCNVDLKFHSMGALGLEIYLKGTERRITKAILTNRTIALLGSAWIVPPQDLDRTYQAEGPNRGSLGPRHLLYPPGSPRPLESRSMDRFQK